MSTNSEVLAVIPLADEIKLIKLPSGLLALDAVGGGLVVGTIKDLDTLANALQCVSRTVGRPGNNRNPHACACDD